MVRIENEFSKFYYTFVLHVIRDSFSGIVQRKLKNSFGMEIDLYNITEIIRLKKYFNAKSENIRTLIFPYYSRIKKTDLTRMIDSPDVESSIQVLAETRYGKLFAPGNTDYIELSVQKIIYEYYKRLLRLSDSSAVSVVAYLQLKRIEINNIISIIEGVRYGLNPSDIGKLLTGTEE